MLLLQQGRGTTQLSHHANRLAQQHDVALWHTANDRARLPAGQHTGPHVVAGQLAPKEAVRHHAAVVSRPPEPKLEYWAHDDALPRWRILPAALTTSSSSSLVRSASTEP